MGVGTTAVTLQTFYKMLRERTILDKYSSRFYGFLARQEARLVAGRSPKRRLLRLSCARAPVELGARAAEAGLCACANPSRSSASRRSLEDDAAVRPARTECIIGPCQS